LENWRIAGKEKDSKAELAPKEKKTREEIRTNAPTKKNSTPNRLENKTWSTKKKKDQSFHLGAEQKKRRNPNGGQSGAVYIKWLCGHRFGGDGVW